MTPLASGAHAISCPDMSVAATKSVDLGTSMSVEFDDRAREIQEYTATPSFVDDTTVGARRDEFRNHSRVTAKNVGYPFLRHSVH